MTILITGAAGFIGSQLAMALINRGNSVLGIDNFNHYYSRRCKEFNVDLIRLTANQSSIKSTGPEIHQVYAKLQEYSKTKETKNKGTFEFHEIDIINYDQLKSLFETKKITAIIHLAAWAGVPLSTKEPITYAKVNVEGTTNLLKLAADHNVDKFLFASSSSVYGHRSQEQVKESDKITNAESVYGATKVAGEVLCHAFYKSRGLKSAIVRIFGPIYGPLQRPYGMLHQRAINYTHNNKTLQIYGRNGLDTAKDATFIDDEIQGIINILDSDFEYEVYNIGNANPLTIKHWLSCIESAFNKKLQIKVIDADTADVTSSADITKAKNKVNYLPQTSMEEGVKRQVEVFKLMPKWYQEMENV